MKKKLLFYVISLLSATMIACTSEIPNSENKSVTEIVEEKAEETVNEIPEEAVIETPEETVNETPEETVNETPTETVKDTNISEPTILDQHEEYTFPKEESTSEAVIPPSLEPEETADEISEPIVLPDTQVEEESTLEPIEAVPSPKSEPTPQKPASEGNCWISATGSKYHSKNNCGTMNPSKATELTIDEAESQGYEKCSKCW